MDYRALLKKYIDHVGSCEGYEFPPRSYDGFTEEELTAWYELAAELKDEYDARYAKSEVTAAP